MLDYKEDKNRVEKVRYRYYDFTEEKIKEIVNKNISDVTNEEWRIILQMLYPKCMIGSGLFQPILIFKINKDGKRIDPPEEAYNGMGELKDNDCLLFKAMNYIEKNSELKIDDSWYKAKEKILKGAENE